VFDQKEPNPFADQPIRKKIDPEVALKRLREELMIKPKERNVNSYYSYD